MIHLFAPPRLGASVTETKTASRSEQALFQGAGAARHRLSVRYGSRFSSSR
jgi:hypothetical protein